MQVLELTELKHVENNLLLSLINDISFGQEKLLAIATELVANPSVLFLDNPTKGLDSLSATRITNCLQVARLVSVMYYQHISAAGEILMYIFVAANCKDRQTSNSNNELS